jgi:hypothetical protein
MPNETEPPEPTESEGRVRDERWDDLRDYLKAAMEPGFTDVAELTEIINTARNEDLRAKLNETVEQLVKPLESWKSIMRRFQGLVKGREIIAEKQADTEADLLDRIREVSKQTDSAEGLHTLAAAHAHLRSFSVAPGWYTS